MELLTTGVLIVVGLIVTLILVVRWYRKVDQGSALIINKMAGKLVVTFTGGVVYPVFHRAEIMDISVKAMEIERTSSNGLICEDNIRADIRVTFYIRVNKTQDDVLKVAQSVGCRRASTKETLEELFQAKFSEALKTVGKQMEFTKLFTERIKFKENIIEVIGEDLNGYKLEDVAIDYLEQTPLSSLDPDNIMDAQGIRKIIERTSIQAKATNELQRDREAVIKQQDVETKEKILELEKQQADAEARQQREIAVIQARETAEAEQAQINENLKAEKAQIASDEEIAVASENKDRQIEAAIKAKERTIAVETERVQRDQELEAVERERLVAIKSIEKEKALEIEKKEIQDVIRERVMVEKTVAIEQEKIKDTIEIATAERARKSQLIGAEKDAEDNLIRETKAAEAKERSAKSLYEETVIQAEAEKVKAEKAAEAMMICAEKEASAKTMMAAAIIEEESALGLAHVKVRKEEAIAIELEGKAQAAANMDRYKANAFAKESAGIAEAKANEALADAEADGIDKKAEAMKKLDEVGREHEEFKLKLNKQERIETAQINVQHRVAEAQAKVLGEAMKTANIDIVGGDGMFLENFFKSISLGKSIDGFVDKSKVASDFLIGDHNKPGFLDNLKGMIAKEGFSGADLKNLSLSALLGKLALSKDPAVKDQVPGIQGMLKGGMGDMNVEQLMTLWMANK